jgi:hypothetical protein
MPPNLKGAARIATTKKASDLVDEGPLRHPMTVAPIYDGRGLRERALLEHRRQESLHEVLGLLVVVPALADEEPEPHDRPPHRPGFNDWQLTAGVNFFF